MEEIIKELEKHFNRICAEEIFEIYQLAAEYYKQINLVESCVQSNQFRDLKDKQKTQTFANLLARKKENLPSFEELTRITKFDQEHYLQYEKEVREKNIERTKILFNLQSFLKLFESGFNSIFVEFDELKKIFDYLHISAYKQVRVFVEIIKNNGFLGLGKSELFLPDYEALINHEYQYITKEEVADILLNEKLEEFLLEENPKNPLGQRELFERFRDTRENYTNIFQISLELDRLFSTKAYDLTEDDYKKIQENMEILSFGDIKDRVIKQMREAAKVYNNPKKDNARDNKDRGKEYNNKNKECISPKKQTNLNQILREINKYYDIETKKLKELLSIDQIIYVLSLMYSIEMEKSIIEDFLRSAMRELKKLHPFAIYNQGYDKFKYLSHENSEIKYHLDMIEYILSDMNFFICSKEEYEEIKQLITEEIDELIYITNGNYQYEEIEAKKILKNNKQEDHYGTNN